MAEPIGDGSGPSPFALIAAAQFLTRVPIRIRRPVAPAAMVVWFPVVGALLGAVLGGVAAALQPWLAPFPTAAITVLVGVLVTGAFHEDGLADCADAIAGGATPERRAEILQDSRLGTYGSAALCGSIVLRVAAVTALVSVGPAVTLAALVAAHAAARGIAVGAMGLGAEPPSTGLAAQFQRTIPRPRIVLAALVALAFGVAATGWWIAPLAGAGVVAAGFFARTAKRAFGGFNGDVYGAIEQIAEIVMVLVAAGLAAHHHVWWR